VRLSNFDSTKIRPQFKISNRGNRAEELTFSPDDIERGPEDDRSEDERRDWVHNTPFRFVPATWTFYI
jgi:hypothetical protein